MAPIRLLFLALLSGCASLFSPLPSEVVLAAAEPIFDLGHPMATFGRAEIVGSSSGSLFGGGSHDRYVDVDVHYAKKTDAHTMRIRFYVHDTQPCHITVDVLQDTGPPPILLDNAVSSKAVGDEMCRAMAEKEPPP